LTIHFLAKITSILFSMDSSPCQKLMSCFWWPELSVENNPSPVNFQRPPKIIDIFGD
jgi:hypothetical protein